MSVNRKTIETFIARNGMKITGSKETIDALIYQTRKLTKELTDAGRYEKTDDVLIESLAMSVEVQRMAFWDIKENGVMRYVDGEGKVKQKNHSISTMTQMTRDILAISSKLGLSALDRFNLKIEQEKGDGLDD